LTGFILLLLPLYNTNSEKKQQLQSRSLVPLTVALGLAVLVGGA
jgi:hypothetical protein